MRSTQVIFLVFLSTVLAACAQEKSETTVPASDAAADDIQLEREPIADTPAPVALAADAVRGVTLYSRLESRVGIDRELDFGGVPSGEFMSNMKFMSTQFSAMLYIENNTSEPLSLDQILIGDADTDEPENPFSTCDVEFEPFVLPTDSKLAFFLCFHPVANSKSSAVASVIDSSGNTVAAVTVRGEGRPLEPGETPPMGLIAPSPTPDNAGAGNVDIVNGVLIETLTGKDVTPKGRDDGLRRKKEPTCIVEITGGGEIPDPDVEALYPGATAINTGNLGFNEGVAGDEINVGQHVILDVLVTCPDGSSPVPTAVLWTIAGDHIKDYTDDIRSGAITEIPMTNPDLIVRPRDLYWKNTGTHQVECKVDYSWNGVPFTANVQRDFVVERDNGDIDRQMEDFYLWNHEANVLKQHYSWHPANPASPCRSTAQRDFFIFHRSMLASANGFRSTFGYPNIIYWDGTQALPVSPDSLHASRAPRNIPFATPSWYTRFGTRNISPCHRATRLADFANADELAEEMEGEWHGVGHGSVGGTMRSFNSPKDPIFFRWHRAVDTVYHNYIIISGNP